MKGLKKSRKCPIFTIKFGIFFFFLVVIGGTQYYNHEVIQYQTYLNELVSYLYNDVLPDTLKSTYEQLLV
ncbi:MAG: hypothetical protein K2G70_06325, partial [Turicibacter sp.]|nr:hypothetical protein [Turicibacter sp.]